MSLDEATVLFEAADLIERVGHCKGTFVRYHGNWEPFAYCAAGAIMEAAGGDNSLAGHVADIVWQHVCHPAGFHSVGGWNDARRRTRKQVVAALRAVGEIAAEA